MSTNVTPATNVTTAPTPTPVLNPSVKLTTGVYAILDAQVKLERKFESMVEQVKADIAEYSYNRDQCRTVLQSAFRQGYEKLAKQDKLDDTATKAYIEVGMKRSGTDISKALTLAIPKDESAATELAKAEAAGLGINARLQIASGKTTTENILAERANKAAGATPETARPGNATNPSVASKPATQPPTPETPQVAKLTPKERFGNQLVACIKFGQSLGLTLDELSDLSVDTFADFTSAVNDPAPTSTTAA